MKLSHIFQAQYTDVLCINSYYSWYSDPGHTEVIHIHASNNLKQWHQTFNKPVIQSEYGADTIPGLHMVRLIDSSVLSLMVENDTSACADTI